MNADQEKMKIDMTSALQNMKEQHKAEVNAKQEQLKLEMTTELQKTEQEIIKRRRGNGTDSRSPRQ